jgi:hypothetical protein
MTQCKITKCESTELVYSGVDAFMLGIPTESICYSCANTYAQVSQIVEGWKESFNDTAVLSTTSC